MKVKLFSLLLIFSISIFSKKAFCQNTATNENIEEAAQWLGERLVDKCALKPRAGSMNVSVNWDCVNTNNLLGTVRIPMKVSWRGGVTGTAYWIKGIFEITQIGLGGSKKTWIKIEDCPGCVFVPACSERLSHWSIDVIRKARPHDQYNCDTDTNPDTYQD